MAHTNYTAAVLALLLVSQLQKARSQSVQLYSISAPISVESVASCSSTSSFDRFIFRREAAPVITRALCISVKNDPSNEPRNIVYFCGNSSSIRDRDVRFTEITNSRFDETSLTTFYIYAIARFAGSRYVVNGDIVAQSITDSSQVGQLLSTTCEPLNSTSSGSPDEYDASSLSGMTIFSSVVLILELIVVGLFSIIMLEFGMGHLASPTFNQATAEQIEQTITGL